MTGHGSVITEIAPGISVVIPIYNGSSTFPSLIERLAAVLEATAEPFEVILVNDGSRDSSWELIHALSTRHTWIHGIDLMRNYGQHNALLCGIRAARYSVTVTLDQDLQNPPEEIPKLLARLREGHDVVYGTPEKIRHPISHILPAKLLGFALGVALGAKTAQISSPFRAFRTRLRGAFVATNSPWVVIDLYLTWATQNFASVIVQHEERPVERSTTYTFRRRFVQALDMITGFSTLPLRITSWIGFLFTLFGIGVLIYVVSVFLLYDTLPGFAFLASTIALFSGAQLFALGILGEYLARMFERMMDRPPYAVYASTREGVEARARTATRPDQD